MSRHQIDYESLAQDAMRGLVRTVLQRVAKSGLPGEHHFYISFHTRGAGVGLSKRLLERYPDEMTIVLQNKFSDLRSLDERFEVTLWFDSIAERLSVPYTAIKVFFDPSVPFGHQFEVADASDQPSHGPVLIDRGAGPRANVERITEARPGSITPVSQAPKARPSEVAPGARTGGKADSARTIPRVPASAPKPQPAELAATDRNPAGASGRPDAAKPAPTKTLPASKAGPVKSGTDKAADKLGTTASPATTPAHNIEAGNSDGKVVPLDAFRKKS